MNSAIVKHSLRSNILRSFLAATATFIAGGACAQTIPTIDCSPNSIAQINTGQPNPQNSSIDKLWKFKYLPAYSGSDPVNWGTLNEAYIITNRTASWTSTPAGSSSAKWIGLDAYGSQPYVDGSNFGNVDGIFQVQFNIDPAVSLTSFRPSMAYSADNSVVDIFVNGTSQVTRGAGTWGLPQAGGSNQFNYNGFGSGRWLTIASMDSPNWVHGLNTLSIYVKSGVNNMGFGAAVQNTATCASNNAPTASPNVNGQSEIGQVLIGTYNYLDSEADLENSLQPGTTYKWVSSPLSTLTDSAQGSTRQSGSTMGTGTSINYTVQNGDAGQYLYYCVIPVAKTGTLVGNEACSVPSSMITIPTPNQAPTATPQISGAPITGGTAYGTYIYADTENDSEDATSTGSSFKWIASLNNIISNSSDGTIRSSGTTSGTNSSIGYTIQNIDLGNYLFYCVKPIALQGILEGQEVCTQAIGPINGITPNPSVKPVPTIDEWALIALSSFIAMFGIIRIRKRQR